MLTIASLLVSLVLIGVALMVMARTVSPALPRMLAALNGASVSSYVNLSDWQRRPHTVRATVRFSRPALRAAA